MNNPAGDAARCIGKSAIPTRGKAERIARRMRAAYRYPLQVYRCHVCGAWHIGGKLLARPPAKQRPWRFEPEEEEGLERAVLTLI